MLCGAGGGRGRHAGRPRSFAAPHSAVGCELSTRVPPTGKPVPHAGAAGFHYVPHSYHKTRPDRRGQAEPFRTLCGTDARRDVVRDMGIRARLTPPHPTPTVKRPEQRLSACAPNRSAVSRRQSRGSRAGSCARGDGGRKNGSLGGVRRPGPARAFTGPSPQPLAMRLAPQSRESAQAELMPASLNCRSPFSHAD